eukprot:CAMPEP_0171136404 /NCGR_PEP_ID=MMETSP0766_2-20121228/131445_1 /TAXON_ID=439317 /ORGANISM="Gambierdiscus australes, Strain CAWD 149" /LENGTH=112 /DNA_ID=CAMNT_0011599937 /DNA_START=8 /DNA_END=343 /DNA_ORIENTATION=-
MAYVYGVTNATGEFVLHFDDDWAMRVADNTGAVRWLRPWLNEFDVDPALVFLQPCDCGQNCRRPSVKDYKEVGELKLLRSPAARQDKRLKEGSYVSLQVYMTKRSHFAMMYP